MVEQAADITLRPACPEDASSLAALSIEVWLGTYLRRGINGFFADYVIAELTPQRMAAHLARDSESIIVSQNAEGIDGFIRISNGVMPPAGPGCAVEIATLYVQPRHQVRGLGQALLQAGLQRCADLGASHPWLTTNSENTSAIGFYQRMGFEITGRTHFQVQDQSYPNEVLTYRP
ncbi:GNAT family N-acetyltransferase [Pseudophaeobacter sp. EL27]|uniref:GNAT family N-acetyltransferase n=1 Tax=Pseudophaeobacter sp. EL27 TaxID=2107580 RepID=UPI000EFCF2AA|nr:GNAT family N-acetyltransferase [Pseudophaeobacter sp. EL27]